MLSFVNPTQLEFEITHENRPIFASFLGDDSIFLEQIALLKEIDALAGEQLKMCLGDEYFLDTFFQWFGFRGTPCYILFSEGAERSRFFGYAGRQKLKEWLAESHITLGRPHYNTDNSFMNKELHYV